MKSENLTLESLAGMIDHTYLKAFATDKDFEKLCAEAKENKFAMVAINSVPVKLCKELLKGTNVHVGAAISFPLGQMSIKSKLDECLNAINDGCDEIDYVLNIGQLKMGHLDYIEEEMTKMVQLCHDHNILIKVILETCYLTDEEIEKACLIAKKVKPDFVKTSTGFGSGGATLEHVALMKKTVGDAVKVKAAGGIRDLKTALAMVDAGAERLGTSAGVKIVEEFKNR